MKKLIYFIIIIGIIGCKKNQPPSKPTIPYGPQKIGLYAYGFCDTEYYFTTWSKDPDNDPIMYKFDWGDGSKTHWSEKKPSEQEYTTSHIYTKEDTFTIRVKAKDIHNNESEWSDPLFIIITKSQPPQKPQIVSYPNTALIDRMITIKVITTDPETHKIRYFYSWGAIGKRRWRGDSTIRIYSSQDTCAINVSFPDTGLHGVTVMAKDEKGAISKWSDTAKINITFPPKPYPPRKPKIVKTYPVYYIQTPFSFFTRSDSLVEEDHKLYFKFDWGDGTESPWVFRPEELLPPDSIPKLYLSHSFIKEGICLVRAKAKDRYEQPSDFSLPCSINIVNHFIAKWEVKTPYGIAINGDNIWVCENGKNQVVKFDPNGNRIDSIGRGILTSPLYIAVDDSCVYVTDESDKIFIFYHNGRLKKTIGNGWEFRLPTGIAVDENYIYVVNSLYKKIQKFDKQGSFVSEWNIPEEGRGMKIYNDTIYVASNMGNKILVYTKEGRLVRTIGKRGDADGYFLAPCDVAIFSDSLYVCDSENDRIQKFAKPDKFVIRWGITGPENGRFNKPQGIAIDNNGFIYICDTANNRIQKFKEASLRL